MLGLYFRDQPYLAVVKENNRVVATACITPPHKLVLSQSLSRKAIAFLVRDLISRQESLPGIIAPKPEALAFAQLWQSMTGQSFHLGVDQHIYQLEVVKPINKTDGYLRLATQRDRSLLISWIKNFTEEALGENEPEQNYQDWCDRRLSQNSLYIWQNDIPVSI